MTASALTGDLTRIVPDILSYSFWDILNLPATFRDSLKNMKVAHNNLLPTRKGRIREAEYTTAKIIIHLLGHEMEYARKNTPDLYKLYMSDQAESLPVSTNQGQLRTMMDHEYGLRSYSNFIDRLMDSGIILHKRNTSRVLEKTVDKQGNVSKCVKIIQGGRGDFILYINKKALTFFAPVVDPFGKEAKSETDVDFGGNSDVFEGCEIIDNQQVTSGQMQNLQPPHDLQLETLKINYNKRGNVENASAEPSKFQFAIANDQQIRDREGIKPLNYSSGAATPEAQIYVEKFEKDARIAGKLPKKDNDFYCKLLFTQLAKQVYPKYTDEHFARIEPHVKNLLNLHLQRSDQPIEDAFQTISRAMYLAKRYLETHPDSYLYAPMTWLRLDDEMKSGTLKTVVDEWIPREEKRLLVYKNKMSEMVKWQYAVRFSDKVFLEVVRALKKSFSLGIRTFRSALERLDSIFEKYELPTSAKKELRKRFADRTYVILKEIDRLGTEEPDPIWAAFQRHQKSKSKTD